MSPFGLTVHRFLDQISPDDVLKFVSAEMRDLIVHLGGEEADRSIAVEIVRAMVDFEEELESPERRTLIIGLLEDKKRSELAAQLGVSAQELSGPTEVQWSADKLDQLKGFFGIARGDGSVAARPARSLIEPEYGLFDYQLVAAQRLWPTFEGGSGRALLHFPTGAGKTRTAMHVVCRMLVGQKPCVVVWVASGKELLEQAEEAFNDAWSHLGNRPVELLTVWGDASPDLTTFEDGFLIVGLAKASAMFRQDRYWAQRLSQRICLVVFDEAHQSVAPTYKKLTEDLLFVPPKALLGLSATPGRTWADIDEDRKVAEMYMEEKVSLEVEGWDNPVSYLMSEGYLSQPTFETLHADPGMTIGDEDRAAIAAGLELDAAVVHQLSMSHQYLAAVLSAVLKLVNEGHTRVLVFAASVEHAKCIAGLVQSKKITARVVLGETSAQARTQAITKFKGSSEDPMILVNFGVLTTGFDAPKVTAAVIARPTASLVLYSQMVGRAIRGPKAGGTSECKIVTVVDPGLEGFGDVAAAFNNWEDVWG
jgi:DNA repair protein RadD